MVYCDDALEQFSYWPGGKRRVTGKWEEYKPADNSAQQDFAVVKGILFGSPRGMLADLSKEERKWLLSLGRALRAARLSQWLLEESIVLAYGGTSPQSKELVLRSYVKALRTLAEQLDFLLEQLKICSPEPLQLEKLQLLIRQLVVS